MYNEEHGVTIGHYHSWKHWHLIPVSRPVINPPTERTNLVTVAGMDGSSDRARREPGKLDDHRDAHQRCRLYLYDQRYIRKETKCWKLTPF